MLYEECPNDGEGKHLGDDDRVDQQVVVEKTVGAGFENFFIYIKPSYGAEN